MIDSSSNNNPNKKVAVDAFDEFMDFGERERANTWMKNMQQ